MSSSNGLGGGRIGNIKNFSFGSFRAGEQQLRPHRKDSGYTHWGIDLILRDQLWFFRVFGIDNEDTVLSGSNVNPRILPKGL